MSIKRKRIYIQQEKLADLKSKIDSKFQEILIWNSYKVYYQLVVKSSYLVRLYVDFLLKKTKILEKTGKKGAKFF